MATTAQVTAAASGPVHGRIVIVALELVGVSLMAIIADMGKTIGNIMVVLMVSFAFIWFISSGAAFFQKPLSKLPASKSNTGTVIA